MSNFHFSVKRVFVLFVFFVGITSVTFAQEIEKEPSKFWKQVQFGGGIGMGFSNGYFSANISPSAIYHFNKTVAMGLGLNASFNNRKNYFKSTILGGSLIGFYHPIQEIQLSTEFEQLHVNRNFDSDYVTNADTKYWIPALFVGAGYRAQNITIGLRYDVLYNEKKSVYPQAWMPFIRVYF